MKGVASTGIVGAGLPANVREQARSYIEYDAI